MLIHPWDRAGRAEWQHLLRTVDFGQVIAPGSGEDYPCVVPTRFVYTDSDQIWFHLARPNPVWRAIDANPRVVFSIIADYTYVEAAWNADPGTDPTVGVPTSYYTAVQLLCTAEVVDDPDEKAAILAVQVGHFEPAGSERVTPGTDVESDRRKLPGIRGLRLSVQAVRAKMKYGGNKTPEHRLEIADRLAERDGPLDAAARKHLLRRM